MAVPYNPDEFRTRDMAGLAKSNAAAEHLEASRPGYQYLVGRGIELKLRKKALRMAIRQQPANGDVLALADKFLVFLRGDSR